MSDHYGKTLDKVPFQDLHLEMEVVNAFHGAGKITKVEQQEQSWADARITIQWGDNDKHVSTRYQMQFDDVIVVQKPPVPKRKPDPDDPRTIAHTLGAFRGSFYVLNDRKPTEQEIFDAGMRGGRDIQWAEKHAVMGHLHPEGLSPEQKVVALAGTVRVAMLALKRIMEGQPDPAKYAGLTIKHLDTPSSKYLISNELSKTDIEAMMYKITAKNPNSSYYPPEPLFLNVATSELCELVTEVLKRSKLPSVVPSKEEIIAKFEAEISKHPDKYLNSKSPVYQVTEDELLNFVKDLLQ